jgi:hypothetical protein
MGKCKRAMLTLLLMGSLWVAAPAHAAPGDVIVGFVRISDFDTPSPFSFSFTFPTTLTGLVSWSANVSGTLTDFTADGISAAPLGGSIFGFLIGGTVVGTDDLGTVSSSFADNYSGIFDCVSGCLTLGLDIHFMGSGGGDVYGMLSGLNVVAAVIPEPGVLVLLVIGLACLAFRRRKRA